MPTGAITSHIDVAQVALYAFWIFFAALIYYIRREDRREGYPLEPDPTDRPRRPLGEVFPIIPEGKTFLLPHGGSIKVPNSNQYRDNLAAEWRRGPGQPMIPTGNPMVDGIGPASYAMRSDTPDLTLEGEPKIVPLRVASDHYIPKGQRDPRGMRVVGFDYNVAGKVVDIWIDLSEVMVRYLEIELQDSSDRVLMPMFMAQFRKVARSPTEGSLTERLASNRETIVFADSILGKQFAQVPRLKDPNQVTLLEEDKICAYYASGHLYATPERAEALI